MTKEEWRPIQDYEGLYEVNNFGDVRSISRTMSYVRFGKQEQRHIPEKILSKVLNKGYLYVVLSRNGHEARPKIHRLVASAFIPNPDNKPEVAHNDGNRANNIVSNLRWATPVENEADKKLHGTHVCGRKVWNAKLHEHQIVEIRTSQHPHTVLSKKYGVSDSHISAIRKGNRWSFLK